MVPKNRARTIRAILRSRGYDDETLKIISPLIDHIVWMEEKIEQARNVISASSVVVSYDNGGGQTGVRKNPAYEALNKLNSSYLASLKLVIDLLPIQETPDNKKDDLIKEVAKKRDLMSSLRIAESNRRGEHNGN